MTALLFCLYVKLLQPSFFNSVDIWSSFSCDVLDNALAGKNVVKEFGVFFTRVFKDTHFVLQKKVKFTKQVVQCGRNLQEKVWNSGRLVYSDLVTILLRAVKSENIAKGTKVCKIVGNLLNKEVDNLEDYGYPKIDDLVDGEILISSSYPFRQKPTFQCAARNGKKLGNDIMQHLKL